VHLVGVADIDQEKARGVAGECGCRPYSDHRALLQEVDAVSIVVPTSLHHRIASDCIDAGVDILLEKPMTVTLAEADELIRRCEQKGLVLQVGHLERFNPALLAMEPYLTLPVFIESNRLSTFKNRGVDVDVVLDLMIHDIDIILHIIKSPLKSIQTVGAPVITATTDIANARLMFENGATANVTASRISRDNMRIMRIFQPYSYINVDFAKRTFMTLTVTNEIIDSGMPREDIQVRTFEAGDALRSEIEDFLQHVTNRTRPVVSGHEGRRALDVALQVMAQIREHQNLEVFRKISEFVRKK
jgi:predicted dehydrogenase